MPVLSLALRKVDTRMLKVPLSLQIVNGNAIGQARVLIKLQRIS